MMKVNLIVTAAGPNQGRAIPIAGEKFIIGRDPECNLRPASQAISKQHCALLVRGGKVFVLDRPDRSIAALRRIRRGRDDYVGAAARRGERCHDELRAHPGEDQKA